MAGLLPILPVMAVLVHHLNGGFEEVEGVVVRVDCSRQVFFKELG
jgi:hypothetical protein